MGNMSKFVKIYDQKNLAKGVLSKHSYFIAILVQLKYSEKLWKCNII